MSIHKILFLIVIFIMFNAPVLAQWHWDSEHINQGKLFEQSFKLLSEASANFRLIETPEFIKKPPHNHVEVKAALEQMKALLNDNSMAEGEAFYPPALQRIIDEFSERVDRVEYSVGDNLVMKIKTNDLHAITAAQNILDWKLLEIPVIFEPSLKERYNILIERLEKALK